MGVPSISQHELSNSEKTAFLDLVKASNTTVPYDLSIVREMNKQEFTPAGNDPLEITNGLIVELITDVFATYRSSLVALPLPYETIYRLFENGSLTLLFRGSWNDSADPVEIVGRTVSNPRYIDDMKTAASGFGFVRFNEQFTLHELEEIEEMSMESLAQNCIDDDRGVPCGDCSLQENEGYRLTYLVADIDVESLRFI